jgi:hypothetical protein
VTRRTQKHKGRKRPKHWHRGQSEARRWQATQLPDVGSGADPTAGAPTPVHRARPAGNTHRGDTL